MDIRKDFPIFRNVPHNWSYLDSGATTFKPRPVIEAVRRFYEQMGVSVHRGDYLRARATTDEYEEVRNKLAAFIGANSEKEISFTKNTNEALNIAAYQLSESVHEGDVIMLSRFEHNANTLPWLRLAKEKGAFIRWFNPSTNLSSLLIESGIPFHKIAIVALTHVSNVTGTVIDLKGFLQAIRLNSPKAKIVIDGAQAVGHLPVNVKELECDYYAFSGHKMYAPSGVGVLWTKQGTDPSPLLVGSHMVNDIEIDQNKQEISYSIQPLPVRNEAGTPNIEGVLGLGAAIDYITSLGWEAIQKHEQDLVVYALDQLKSIKGELIGSPFSMNRVGIFSVVYGQVHAHDVAQALDVANVAVRSGHHCSIALMNYLGITGCTRASFGIYTTKGDIDNFVKGLKEMEKFYHL